MTFDSNSAWLFDWWKFVFFMYWQINCLYYVFDSDEAFFLLETPLYFFLRL